MGAAVLAPVLLDAGARTSSCRQPVQYAFDFAHPMAAQCISTYIESDLGLGADGSCAAAPTPALIPTSNVDL